MPVTSTGGPVKVYTLMTKQVLSQEIIKRKAVDSKQNLLLDLSHFTWESNKL